MAIEEEAPRRTLFPVRAFDLHPEHGYEITDEETCEIWGFEQEPVRPLDGKLVIFGFNMVKTFPGSYHDLLGLFSFLSRDQRISNLLLYRHGFLHAEYTQEEQLQMFYQRDKKNIRYVDMRPGGILYDLDWTPPPQRPTPPPTTQQLHPHQQEALEMIRSAYDDEAVKDE